MDSPRNASVAVIGAGDFIGAAIARRFAAEGYRRLRRPAQRREARAARSPRSRRPAADASAARSMPARRRTSPPFCSEADAHAPLEVCIFNVGANVNFPILDTTERVFRKVWEMACYAGFLAGREAARLMLPRGRGLASSSPAPPPACAAARATPPSPAPSSACARSRRAWRASSGRRTSTSRIW